MGDYGVRRDTSLGCISCIGSLKEEQAEQEEQGTEPVTLRLREASTIPIEADAICPDQFVNRSEAEIEALPVFYGRRQVTLGDLFEVDGEYADHIAVRGVIGAPDSLRPIKRIGQGMRRGRIVVHGDAGMHLGAEMRGGEIVVQGNVAAWAGAHMAGGVLRVAGDAGPMLGAAYPGETRGMRGGLILVHGNVGPRAGERMRRGMIVVGGDAGEFAGVRMIAGSLLVFGTLGARAGAGMKRGTIVAVNGQAEALLPTFRYACTSHITFMRVYLRRLRERDDHLPITDAQIAGAYRRYTGDINTLGKGEILIYAEH